jgi:hypothetical protein
MGLLKKISYVLMICLMLILNGQMSVFAEGKKDQFMPKETYDFLFETAMQIIAGDPEFIGRIIMITNTFQAEPRLKPYHRPRRTEYTTFSFDGYWVRHFWPRDPIGTGNWNKDNKQLFEEENTPGRWYFRVRWTTRKEPSQTYGQINIIKFAELLPEVYFIEHGGLERRHDMTITHRFPDKHHTERGYVNGFWLGLGGELFPLPVY